MLDPLPTSLVKANIDILAPTLAAIINMSLESGTVPATFKHAVITPLLKKPNLDPDLMNNYRPISNLSFVSKLLERHVAIQLRHHLDNNDLLDIFQSAYRKYHSTETALVRIQNAHLKSVDKKKGVLTVLLDMSAAFDTVDHSVLIGQMRSIGIEGTALKWLESYMSNRTHTVRIGSHNSHRTLIESGIPQGSVLGPVLFSIYTLPLGAIFRKHQLQYHLYADDAQLYVDLSRVPDGETADAVCRVERCIEEARLWMSDHNLLLNESKTEAIIISAPNRKHLQDVSCVSVCGCNIVPSPTIRNLGIMIDCELTMSSQVSRMCKAAYYHLYAISKIRHCLTTEACKIIVHALVISRLDYGNALLYGITEALMTKLQMVQNSAARLIARQRKHQHITPVLIKLHWLPVRWRVQYKLLVLVFSALHELAPKYIQDLVTPYSPNRNLRSADQCLLVVPRYNLEGYGRWAFSVSGPALWNSLPENIRQSDTLAKFKTLLKTHLFKLAYYQ